jgi:hypothetical protein
MTSPLRLEDLFGRCELVAPGHNLPAKLRLGKLRRISLSGAHLEKRGEAFLLHRFCLRLPGCGSSYLQSLLFSTATETRVRPRFCLCREEFATHDAESLARAIESRDGVELFEVKTKKLGGLLIYVPQTEQYFWLEKSHLFFWRNDKCQKMTRALSNEQTASSWYTDGPFIYEPTDYILGCTGPPD